MAHGALLFPKRDLPAIHQPPHSTRSPLARRRRPTVAQLFATAPRRCCHTSVACPRHWVAQGYFWLTTGTPPRARPRRRMCALHDGAGSEARVTSGNGVRRGSGDAVRLTGCATSRTDKVIASSRILKVCRTCRLVWKQPLELRQRMRKCQITSLKNNKTFIMDKKFIVFHWPAVRYTLRWLFISMAYLVITLC